MMFASDRLFFDGLLTHCPSNIFQKTPGTPGNYARKWSRRYSGEVYHTICLDPLMDVDYLN